MREVINIMASQQVLQKSHVQTWHVNMVAWIILWSCVLFFAGSGKAMAQTMTKRSGVDCNCFNQGSYVASDPGSLHISNGHYNVTSSGSAVLVTRADNGATVFERTLGPLFRVINVGFNGDGSRLVFQYFQNASNGSLNGVTTTELYDLTAGRDRQIWASSAVGSVFAVFSPYTRHLRYEVLTQPEPTQARHMSLSLIDATSGRTSYQTEFNFISAPGNDGESFGSMRGGFDQWGNTFVYAYVSGQSTVEWNVVNIDAGRLVHSETLFNPISSDWSFSPCGDVVGLVEQTSQLQVNVRLFSTLTGKQLGERSFPLSFFIGGLIATIDWHGDGIAPNTAPQSCLSPTPTPTSTPTPTPIPTPTYSIAGRVVENGVGIGGVNISLNGLSSATAVTDAGGFYSFAGLAAGGYYTVMASRPGIIFSPTNQVFPNLRSSQTAGFVVAGQARYVITDLGTLGGRTSRAYGINSRGEVVGESLRSRNAPNSTAPHAFIYRGGTMTDLGILSETDVDYGDSRAYAINDSGTAAGSSKDNFLQDRAVRFSSIFEPSKIDVPAGFGESLAYGINDSGQIVGYARPANGSPFAFITAMGSPINIGALAHEGLSFAYDVNNNGHVVGTSSTADGSYHAFLYSQGVMRDLTPTVHSDSAAYAINDSDQIVGALNANARGSSLNDALRAGKGQAVLWSGGGMITLGSLTAGGNSIACAINNAGQVVGQAAAEGGISCEFEDGFGEVCVPRLIPHAFVWEDGVMRDLNDLVPAGSGWVLNEARGINTARQIVGTGTINGERRAFLLTPVSLPRPDPTPSPTPAPEPGLTPVGSNVTVQLGGVKITFANVTAAGMTTVTPIDPASAGQLPGGFAILGGLAFDISTTAVFDGPLTISFNVPTVTDPAAFADLRVFHGEGGVLVDRTILAPDTPAPDFATKTVSARTTSLSPFVVAKLVDHTSPATVAALSQAPNAAGWHNRDVTVTLTVTDDGGAGVREITYSVNGADTTADGPSASIPVTSEGATTISFFATDAVGNVEAVQSLTIKLDKTTPTINAARDTPPNAAGWNNADVTASHTAVDSLSGLVSPSSGSFTFTQEGGGQSHTFTVEDLAGNTNSATVNGVNIDKTAPDINAVPNVPANASGWHNTDVTVSFPAWDALSGLVTESSPVTLKNEGAGQIVTGTVTDRAGNTATVRLTINIDKTAPETFMQFDPATKDVLVFGRDTQSGVAPDAVAPFSVTSTTWAKADDDDDDGDRHGAQNGKAEQRTYHVPDLAGNVLTLVLEVRQEGHEVKARLVSLQYNTAPSIVATRNKQSYEWATARNGALRELEQALWIGSGRDRQKVEAEFKIERTLTIIRAEKPERKIVRPGLALLRLVSDKGRLVIEY